MIIRTNNIRTTTHDTTFQELNIVEVLVNPFLERLCISAIYQLAHC